MNLNETGCQYVGWMELAQNILVRAWQCHKRRGFPQPVERLLTSQVELFCTEFLNSYTQGTYDIEICISHLVAGFFHL